MSKNYDMCLQYKYHFIICDFFKYIKETITMKGDLGNLEVEINIS